MFDEKFSPVKAILIGTNQGDIKEITLDISTKTSQVSQYLGGPGTFIGQWEKHDIVIMKCREFLFEPNCNNNKLSYPFTGEKTLGPILLIKMDETSNPQNLTLEDIEKLKLVNKPFPYRLRSNSNPS